MKKRRNTTQYTNEQKIAHYRAKIKKFEGYIANLEQLPPDEYTSQDWKGQLSEQVKEAQVKEWVKAALLEHLQNTPKKLTKA